MEKDNVQKLGILFKEMFLLSSCTFGGGFVIVSLMKKKFVEERKWLSEEEMLDVTAIAQSSPGPIMVNAAVVVGYRINGILGSLVAVLGSILPPMIILSVISLFYTQFRENTYIAIALQVMRAGVAAVIVDVVINLARNVGKTKRILYIVMAVLAFIGTCFCEVGALTIIGICFVVGILDLVYHTVTKRKAVK